MLGEYGVNATDVKAEFIWTQPDAANDNGLFGGGDGVGGYAPLAVAVGDGSGGAGATTFNWVHGNHMGVPLIITDASGNPAPAADYAAPGFPGQSRTLADLYYNRYRDYDPTTGRYIQADPIGLAGDVNPYAYAGGNPVKFADPSGLCPFCLVIPAVCAGGGCEALGILGAGALWWATHPMVMPPSHAVAMPIPDAKPQCSPEGDGDVCVAGWINERDNYCARTFRGSAYRRCVNRANDRLLACKREKRGWPPTGPDRWSYQDEYRFRP